MQIQVSQKAFNVFLVDDNQALVGSLESYLSNHLPISTNKISSFNKDEDFLSKMKEKKKPDVVVLGLSSRTKTSNSSRYGIDILKKIKYSSPKTSVIMLSDTSKANLALDSMKNGAFDYVVKDESIYSNVLTSIRKSKKIALETREIQKHSIIAFAFIMLLIALVGIISYLHFFNPELFNR